MTRSNPSSGELDRRQMNDRNTAIRVVVDAHCGLSQREAARRFAVSIEEVIANGLVSAALREVHVIRTRDNGIVLVYCRDPMTVLGVQYESQRGEWHFSSHETVIAARLGPLFAGRFGSRRH